MQDILLRGASAGNLTVLGEKFHTFSPHGVTGMLVRVPTPAFPGTPRGTLQIFFYVSPILFIISVLGIHIKGKFLNFRYLCLWIRKFHLWGVCVTWCKRKRGRVRCRTHKSTTSKHCCLGQCTGARAHTRTYSLSQSCSCSFYLTRLRALSPAVCLARKYCCITISRQITNIAA